MTNRQDVINQAIDGLESGTVQPPASMTQDPAALADTLRQDSQGGSARAFAAYKNAQRINATTA
jgi:hypothetical protein